MGRPLGIYLSVVLLATGCGFSPGHRPASGTTIGSTASTTSVRTRWWHPRRTGPNDGPEFQWELDHPLRLSSPADLGLGARNAAGRRSPRPTVYDIDGIENPAQFQAASDLGRRMPGYPERYLNINAASTVSIIEA